MKEPTLSIAVFDRSNNSIPVRGGNIALAPSFSNRIDMGFDVCEFGVLGARLTNPIPAGYKVRLSERDKVVWEGMVEESVPMVDMNTGLVFYRIRANGFGQFWGKRLGTFSYGLYAIYLDYIIEEMLFPLANNEYSVDVSGINLLGRSVRPAGVIAATNAYINTLWDQYAQAGDSADRPVRWAIWESHPTGICQPLRWDFRAGPYYHWDNRRSAGGGGAFNFDIHGGLACLENQSNAVGGYAFQWYYQPLPADRIYRLRERFVVWNGSGLGDANVFAIHFSAVAPAANVVSNFIHVYHTTAAGAKTLYIRYWTGAAWVYWNQAGGVWQAGVAGYGVTANVPYIIEFESNSSQWTLILEDNAGNVLFTCTAVDWTSVGSYTLSHWVLYGDWSTLVNDNYTIINYLYGWWPLASKPTIHIWAKNRTAALTKSWFVPLSSVVIGENSRIDVSVNLNDVVNYVLALYGATYTAAASSATSIAAYGQRDYIVQAGSVDVAVAQNMRDTELADKAFPKSTLSNITLEGPVLLNGRTKRQPWEIRAGDWVHIPVIMAAGEYKEVHEVAYKDGRVQIGIDDIILNLSRLVSQARNS